MFLVFLYVIFSQISICAFVYSQIGSIFFTLPELKLEINLK